MHRRRWLVGLAGVAGVGIALAPGTRAPAMQTPGIVGTWKLFSAKENGKALDLPAGTTILKHVTPTDFVFVYYDASGQITVAGGGPYRVRGARYEETVEYGLGAGVKPLIGKTQVFTLRIEGTRWYHSGQESEGTVVEEVWERVQRARSP